MINESNIRFKIRTFLQMAQLTSDTVQRQEYIDSANNLIELLCDESNAIYQTCEYFKDEEAEKITNYLDEMSVGDAVSCKEMSVYLSGKPPKHPQAFARALNKIIADDGRFENRLVHLPYPRCKQRYWIKECERKQ